MGKRGQMNIELSMMKLAGMIDYSFLNPDGTKEVIKNLCEDAKRYGFVSVAVTPTDVPFCKTLLRGDQVRICSVVGFPLGLNTINTKKYELIDSIKLGANEVDMVINIRALKSEEIDVVREEVSMLVHICNDNGVISKVILETCYLTENEKRLVCKIAVEKEADFVKTSTGFASKGATIADIKLMREFVGPNMGIKAAGGIRDLSSLLQMVNAGATRIGTSSGVEIMEEFKRKLDTK